MQRRTFLKLVGLTLSSAAIPGESVLGNLKLLPATAKEPGILIREVGDYDICFDKMIWHYDIMTKDRHMLGVSMWGKRARSLKECRSNEKNRRESALSVLRNEMIIRKIKPCDLVSMELPKGLATAKTLKL